MALTTTKSLPSLMKATGQFCSCVGQAQPERLAIVKGGFRFETGAPRNRILEIQLIGRNANRIRIARSFGFCTLGFVRRFTASLRAFTLAEIDVGTLNRTFW
jgi:hypothetical protein